MRRAPSPFYSCSVVATSSPAHDEKRGVRHHLRDDRSRRPRNESCSSRHLVAAPLGEGPYAAATRGTAILRLIPPHRVQNARQPPRERDDGDAPAAPRGQRSTQRERGAPLALAPDDPRRLDQQRAHRPRAGFRDGPFPVPLGGTVFARHQPEKRRRRARIAKARRRVQAPPDTSPPSSARCPGTVQQPADDRVGAGPRPKSAVAAAISGARLASTARSGARTVPQRRRHAPARRAGAPPSRRSPTATASPPAAAAPAVD